MNIENCLFFGLTLIFASLFVGTIELPALIFAGAVIGKFLPIWLQIIIALIVIGVYYYKAKKSDTSMETIYYLFILYFFVSLIMGNSYYYLSNHLLTRFPVLNHFLTTPFFTINMLR